MLTCLNTIWEKYNTKYNKAFFSVEVHDCLLNLFFLREKLQNVGWQVTPKVTQIKFLYLLVRMGDKGSTLEKESFWINNTKKL